MNRNRLTRITITTLALILSLVTFGCQGDQTAPTDPPKQEDEEQETESQTEDQIRTVPMGEITNITWMWSELTENEPAAQSVVPDPENYTLTFWDDGTFSFKSDCNNGSGSYKVEGHKIEFGPMASNMAMCAPESLHDPFLSLLGEIDTFGLAGDKLAFTLKEDAGEMRFVHGGPAEKPAAPTEEPETAAPVEKSLFVCPEKAECVGVAPQECFLVKEDPDDEWQYFYDQIEGFEWEPGYTYELRVAVHPVENPPADGSSLRYELIEVVDKAATPVEPEQT